MSSPSQVVDAVGAVVDTANDGVEAFEVWRGWVASDCACRCARHVTTRSCSWTATCLCAMVSVFSVSLPMCDFMLSWLCVVWCGVVWCGVCFLAKAWSLRGVFGSGRRSRGRRRCRLSRRLVKRPTAVWLRRAWQAVGSAGLLGMMRLTRLNRWRGVGVGVVECGWVCRYEQVHSEAAAPAGAARSHEGIDLNREAFITMPHSCCRL